MSLVRINPKRDASEQEVVNALERGGASVARISGIGIPDLAVGYRGRTYLVECKSKGGRFTGRQIRFYANWCGNEVPVMRTAADAVKWLQMVKA